MKNSSAGWARYWDSESHTPFAITRNQLIAYDNERSIGEKIQFAMEKGLAGAMVWSIDTDDFHGDCSDVTDENAFVNFPLMRSVNKAIETTLKDLENVVNRDKGKEPNGGNSHQSGRLALGFCALFALFYNIVI